MSDRPVTDMKSIVCINNFEMTLNDFDQEMRQGGDSWGAAPAEWCFYQSFTSSPYRVRDRNMGSRNRVGSCPRGRDTAKKKAGQSALADGVAMLLSTPPSTLNVKPTALGNAGIGER